MLVGNALLLLGDDCLSGLLPEGSRVRTPPASPAVNQAFPHKRSDRDTHLYLLLYNEAMCFLFVCIGSVILFVFALVSLPTAPLAVAFYNITVAVTGPPLLSLHHYK